jgi:hypothetical protein
VLEDEPTHLGLCSIVRDGLILPISGDRMGVPISRVKCCG